MFVINNNILHRGVSCHRTNKGARNEHRTKVVNGCTIPRLRSPTAGAMVVKESAVIYIFKLPHMHIENQLDVRSIRKRNKNSNRKKIFTQNTSHMQFFVLFIVYERNTDQHSQTHENSECLRYDIPIVQQAEQRQKLH